MKTIVVKLKDGKTLANLADEVFFWFGEGSRPDFSSEEEAFAFNNTPVQNGWLRIPATDEFVAGIEYMLGKTTSEVAEVIQIEHDYQHEVIVDEYDDPEAGHVRELLGYIGNGNFPPLVGE